MGGKRLGRATSTRYNCPQQFGQHRCRRRCKRGPHGLASTPPSTDLRARLCRRLSIKVCPTDQPSHSDLATDGRQRSASSTLLRFPVSTADTFCRFCGAASDSPIHRRQLGPGIQYGLNDLLRREGRHEREKSSRPNFLSIIERVPAVGPCPSGDP